MTDEEHLLFSDKLLAPPYPLSEIGFLESESNEQTIRLHFTNQKGEDMHRTTEQDLALNSI